MKRQLVLIGLIAVLAGPAAADDLAGRIEAGRAAIKAFATALQAELKAGMAAGGPVNAIGVCNHAAPDIAASQSAAHGLSLGRTSLKTRNAGNAPDAWELAVLNDFEARKAAGADITTLDHAEIVTDGGRQEFRYMKAIPTKAICLTCHGQSLAPELVAKLDELYPQDQARGFAVGDIRGAFTISQPVE